MNQTVLIFKTDLNGGVETVRDDIKAQIDDERVKVVVLPRHTEYVMSTFLDDELRFG